MNVAELEGVERRFIRLYNRAAILTFGGASVMNKASPMQPLLDAKGLDKLVVNELPFDSVQTILFNLSKRGVTTAKKGVYRKACLEGWAPPPTNKYQRVIWEKVKAEQSEQPSNPLKITPGMKPKGK
jgi:hypothetical protein